MREELSSPAALGEWIEAHGLPGADAALDEDDLRRAIEFRESLRSFVLANNGEELDPAAVPAANDIATRAHFVLRFDDQGEGGLEPRRRGDRPRARSALGDRGAVDDRRHVDTAQGVPQPHVRVGVLRPLEEPFQHLVHHGRMRQPE